MGGVCEGQGIPPTNYEAQLCRQECQSETQVADAQTCSLLVSHVLCSRGRWKGPCGRAARARAARAKRAKRVKRGRARRGCQGS